MYVLLQFIDFCEEHKPLISHTLDNLVVLLDLENNECNVIHAQDNMPYSLAAKRS